MSEEKQTVDSTAEDVTPDWRATFAEHATWAEGFRQFPYTDTVGKVTIGIGRNLDDNGLSEDEVMYLFRNDSERVIKECESLDFFDGLNDARKIVIADMVFNLGLPRFKGFVKTIAAIRAKDWQNAAAQMQDSKWYRQTGRRAQRLVQAMATGEWPR